MNRKIAILGDTHFGYRKSSDIFTDYFKDFLDNQFFPYLIENDIKYVIQLGDLFDSRKYINGKTLKFVNESYFSKFDELGITLYQMIGNHDVFYKNTNKVNWIESILSTSSYKNIILCDEPKTFNIHDRDLDIIPWINEENNNNVFSFINDSKSDMLFGHLELSGFELTPGFKSTHGLKMSQFKKYKKVISGHYHIRSTKKNIMYSGIPYQLNWSDAEDKKGFWVLDLKDDSMDYIENPRKLFRKIDYDEDFIDNDFDFNQFENSFVKVYVRNKKDKKKYENFLTRLNSVSLFDLSIISNNELIETEIDLDEIHVEDTLSMLKSFVLQNTNDNLNKESIVNHVNSLYEEGLLLMKEV